MLSNVSNMITPLANYFSGFYGMKTIGDLAGRAIKNLSSMTSKIQHSPNFSYGVVLTTNALFFSLTHFFANTLHKRVEAFASSEKKPLNDEQKSIKSILIDGLFVGGSTYAFNVIFSKLTHLPLSTPFKLALSATAIAVRILLTRESKKADPAGTEPVIPEEKPVEPIIPDEKPPVKPVVPEEKPVEPILPEEKPVDPIVPEEKPVDPIVPEEKPIAAE